MTLGNSNRVAILIAIVACSLTAAAQERHWIGTWATAAQPSQPTPEKYQNQTLRLIVHTSTGGKRVRVKLSNTYGDQPLVIGAAHIARRATDAAIDPASDRVLQFHGEKSTKVAAHSLVTSDPVDLDVPALSDLAISIFLPDATAATTFHLAAKQTNYVSTETGDATGEANFPVAKKIRSWPFLTGVDVEASAHGASIVAIGSSLTDGDGTTVDTNHRWTDILAARLQKAGGRLAELGVLNEGIIGNRLLADSPADATPFGASLGEAGLARFERDVLSQPGVKYVVIGLGINDICFPGSLTPPSAAVTAEQLIAGYRQLIARAHKKGIRVIGTTNAGFEDAFLKLPSGTVTFFTPEKERVRVAVNEWMLKTHEFDGVVDFDKMVRDPSRPTRLLPSLDSGDHVHPNNAGYELQANAIPLSLFE